MFPAAPSQNRSLRAAFTFVLAASACGIAVVKTPMQYVSGGFKIRLGSIVGMPTGLSPKITRSAHQQDQSPSPPTANWSAVLSMAAVCGLAVGAALPSKANASTPPNMSSVNAEASEASREAYLQWKTTTSIVMANYNQEMNPLEDQIAAEKKRIVFEKQAAYDQAALLSRNSLAGDSEKVLAERAAVRRANDALREVEALYQKEAGRIEHDRMVAMKRATAEKELAVKASADAKVDAFRNYEADQLADKIANLRN